MLFPKQGLYQAALRPETFIPTILGAPTKRIDRLLVIGRTEYSRTGDKDIGSGPGNFLDVGCLDATINLDIDGQAAA